MVWDNTKSNFEQRSDVPANQKIAAEEWNQHVEDGHFPADEVNFGVDGNGNPVVTDPQNTDEVIATYDRSSGAWVFDAVEASTSLTDPAGVTHTGELADIDDVGGDVSVSDDGTQVVSAASDINFTGISVADDGDNTVTIGDTIDMGSL